MCKIEGARIKHLDYFSVNLHRDLGRLLQDARLVRSNAGRATKVPKLSVDRKIVMRSSENSRDALGATTESLAALIKPAKTRRREGGEK